MPSWVTQQEGGDCLVTVWVVPGASRNQVVGAHGDALKVKVAAPPEAGKANKAVLKLIADLTGAKATLESGASSRRKIVRIHDLSPDGVVRTLT